MEVVCSLCAGVTKPILDSFQISLRSPCNLVTNHVRNDINFLPYDKFLNAFKPSRRRQITHLGFFSKRIRVSQFLRSNDVNEVSSQCVESFISLVCDGLNVCPQYGTSTSRKFRLGPQLMCKATGRGPGRDASQAQGKGQVGTTRNQSQSSRESNGCLSSQGFAALASLKAQLDQGAAIGVVDANVGYEERVTKKGNQGTHKRKSSTHASKSSPKYMIENPESSSLSRSEEPPQASTFNASDTNSKATIETLSSISSIKSNDCRQMILRDSLKSALKENIKTSSVENDVSQTNDFRSREQGLRIRLSNLPNQLSKEEFDALMKSVPGLSSWVYLSNRAGGCRGYCFCEAVTEGDVVPAIEALSQQVVQGRNVKANISVSPSVEENEGSQAEDLKPRPNLVSKTKDSDKLSKAPLNQSGPKADINRGSQTSKAILQGDIRKMPQDFKRGTRTEAPLRNGKNPGEEVQKSQNIPLEYGFALESDDQGVLKGSDILAAMQRAAAAQRVKSVRKRREGGKTLQMKGEDRESQEVIEEGPPQPIVIKQEWGDQIQCLEKLLNDLRQTLS